MANLNIEELLERLVEQTGEFVLKLEELIGEVREVNAELNSGR